jgi:hypothetical protein
MFETLNVYVQKLWIYEKKSSHDSIIKLLDAKFVITYQKEFASISSNDV